ncbi:MAG: lamin tail domain-containing protein [Candidatus Niyogibacteria bacterium]|nr:lamin tail domain-containing protein [Candidatus Niyogibacteria bacterium]
MKYSWHKIFIIFLLLFWSGRVFAYDDQTTHPALTDEIVDFYNLFSDVKLTSEEKEWVVQGAMDEDTPPRWINHFYDPIYKVGWTGENTGIWPAMLIKYFSEKILSSAEPVSSLDWLHNQKLQAEYGDYQGNRTWERAIYEYANGNTKEAYYTLGYILHLIEDATVPDHTRDDTHAHELQFLTGDFGSPYEEFSKRFTRSALNIAGELARQGLKPIAFASADDYLASLAEYSNKYFFSKDTINDPKYADPKIVREENEYGYGMDKNGEEFEVIGFKIVRDLATMQFVSQYFFPKNNNDNGYEQILSQYFTRLSREAIINGAGVIDLFLREGEKAKQDLNTLEKPPPETAGISSLMNEAYAIFDFFSKTRQKITDAVDFLKLKLSVSKKVPITANIASPAFDSISTTDIDIEPDKLLTLEIKQTEEVFNPVQEINLEIESPSLEDLQASLDEAKTKVKVLENQLAEIAQTQAHLEAEHPNQLAALPPHLNISVGALPYAGFGGGAASAVNENSQVSNSNNQNEPLSDIIPPVGSEAPAMPTLTIAECQNSLAVGACLTATTTLHLNWSSPAQDLDYFELSYGNLTSTTTSTTIATSTVLNLSDNTAYAFSLRLRDQSGNWSQATTSAAEISAMPVVINEAAWMGTASSTEDEWIELYNRTNHAINLNNWVLRVSDNRPYIPLSGIISAKGYYLLERADDKTISDIGADLVYGNDGADWALNNTGIETLILSYASTTIDSTPLASWPAGTISNYRTMERYDPDISGEELSNWGTNITIIRNSKDGAGNPLNGTPKARNSVNYLIAKGAATISNENVVLTKANSPYLVNNIVQVFQNGSILTIEPGVVLKFYNDAGMNFNQAAIMAQGASNTPIVFTSFYDDEYGGDTNADATSSVPSIGDWYGVDVVFGSNGSILDRVIFRYGGKYYAPTSETDRVLVKIQDTPDISIKNSIFEYSKAHGLVLINSTSTVENNIFRYNDNYSEQGKGLFVSSGNYTIKNNEFSQNQTGLYLSDAPAAVDANTFSNNMQKAINSSGAVGKFTNNLALQNGLNGIVLDGNLAAASATSTLKADNIPYVISGATPVVPVNSGLAVESGAIIKGLSKGLQVSGRLTLNGENPEDIIFTSLYDDAIGGDTDNGVNSPTPGDWPGLNLANTASLEGKGFTVRYAGSRSGGGNDSAGLKMAAGSANITNALFKENYPYGIYAAAGSNLNISNSRFENHNYSGPWGTKAALAVFNSTTTLANVSFTNNLLGIISDTSSVWLANAVEFVNNAATTSPAGLF